MFTISFITLVWSFANVNSAFASHSCNDLAVTISNQSDISFYSTCPVIEDEVFIDHSFTGPFELPGVQSLGMFAGGYYLPKLKGENRTEDATTSISFPDLLNVTWPRGLFIGYMENLTDISFPKLQSIGGELGMLENPKLRSVSFPALTNVTNEGYFTGYFDEIHFPALKSISYIRIESYGKLDCIALGKNLSSLTFTPRQYESYSGFSCWTPYATNTYNSPSSTQTSTATTSKSTSSSTSSNTGASTSAAAKSSAGRIVTSFGTEQALGLVVGIMVWGMV